MASLIILHNWFPVEIRGFVVAVWVSSAQIISILQAAYFTQKVSEHYIMECLIMSGLYLILSVICLFFFYHHPLHIGVVVTKHSGEDDGFFMDSMGTNYALSAT